jgi:mono/diheme cytochrome c family protein
MKQIVWRPGIVAIALCVGCSHRQAAAPSLHSTAAGSALVESSGGKQLGSPATTLAQPLVVQVNDKLGNSVTGALVAFRGPAGAVFDPPQVLTDSSGQATTQVALGVIAGRYDLTASSTDAAGKPFVLSIAEYAAGYQQQLGYEVQKTYCSRCHDPESTTQQVSNFDNLAVKPHPFSEGDTLNKLSESDLAAIISHGGQSMNLSALMPPYGATLSKPEVQALIAYIRLVSEPPYKPAGVVYAKR